VVQEQQLKEILEWLKSLDQRLVSGAVVLVVSDGLTSW